VARRLTTAALVSVAALATPATPSALGAHAPHPTAGNWEAVGSAASFDVVRRRTHGRSHWTLSHVVLTTTATCGKQGSAPTVTQQAAAFPAHVDVSAHGTISGRQKSSTSQAVLSGRFSSSRTASIDYRAKSTVPDVLTGGTLTCSYGPIRLRLRPGHRVPVPDGTWKGTAANGELVTMRVRQGGRLIEGDPTAHPTAGAFTFGTFHYSCAGTTCVAASASPCASDVLTPAFIAADGTFDSGPPTSGQLGRATGTFEASGIAHGQWTDASRSATNSCDASWSATAPSRAP
jgi:hypothetical protein